MRVIEGNCMRPWLCDGDLVWFDPTIEARDGDLVMVRMAYSKFSLSVGGQQPIERREAVKQLRVIDGERYLACADDTMRHVGREAFADLFNVLQDAPPRTAHAKWLELSTLFAPYGVHLRRTAPAQLRLTLQAQSDEADSAPLRVLAKWNGRWDDGAGEMAQHVVVTVE